MNLLQTTAPEIRVLDSRLNHSLFQRSDLHGSRFEHCDLSGVAFEHCVLEGASLDGVPLDQLLECWRLHHRPGPPQGRRSSRSGRPGGPAPLFEPEEGDRG